MELVYAFGTGLGAFVASNIDTLVILLALFARSEYSTGEIVAGQYLGMAFLIGLSMAGSLAASAIAPAWIGLLGLVPLVMGLVRLKDAFNRNPKATEDNAPNRPGRWPGAGFLAVALISISDGGDNIGVYVPLFANSPRWEIGFFTLLFLVLTGAWCVAAHFLVHRTGAGDRIRRVGHILLPFVLIILGVVIVSHSFAAFHRG